MHTEGHPPRNAGVRPVVWLGFPLLSRQMLLDNVKTHGYGQISYITTVQIHSFRLFSLRRILEIIVWKAFKIGTIHLLLLLFLRFITRSMTQLHLSAYSS